MPVERRVSSWTTATARGLWADQMLIEVWFLGPPSGVPSRIGKDGGPGVLSTPKTPDEGNRSGKAGGIDCCCCSMGVTRISWITGLPQKMQRCPKLREKRPRVYTDSFVTEGELGEHLL